MLIEHRGKRPSIHESAFVTPTAVVCGDVTIGPRTYIGFGAIVVSHGCPVTIGTQSIIRENAVVRVTEKHVIVFANSVIRSVGGAARPAFPVEVRDHTLVAPLCVLTGCSIGPRKRGAAFLRTTSGSWLRLISWSCRQSAFGCYMFSLSWPTIDITPFISM